MSSSAATPLPAPTPGVMFQSLDDGAVLFSADSEVYFGLNHVGARIWELLPPQTATVEELCDALTRTYAGVEPAQMRQDVTELLAQLELAGLVRTQPPVGERPA